MGVLFALRSGLTSRAFSAIMNYKYSPDAESTAMLSIIREGLVCDLGGIYAFSNSGGSVADMGKLLYEAGTASGMYTLYTELKPIAEQRFSDWAYIK